jgi:hypothetical protein
MRDMWWMVAVVGFVVLVASYLTWTASRVDRLHRRAVAAHGALDAQLIRRAEVAASLAGVANQDSTLSPTGIAVPVQPAGPALTLGAAKPLRPGLALGGRLAVEPGLAAGPGLAVEPGLASGPGLAVGPPGVPALHQAAYAALAARPDDREAAENDLTRQLRGYLAGADEGLDEIVAVSRRVALAREVHNGVVRDALAVRRRLVVRTLGLARKHPAPRYFDIDDPAVEAPRPPD